MHTKLSEMEQQTHWRWTAGRRRWILLFVLLSASFLTISYFNYRNALADALQDTYVQLSAVADLKSSQIIAWREEHEQDCATLSKSPPLVKAVAELVRGTADPAHHALVVELLKLENDEHQFTAALVVGLDGEPLATCPEGNKAQAEATRKAMAAALEAGAPVMSDLYRMSTGEIRINVAAPIVDTAGAPLAVLILRIDPDQSLYSVIQSWSTPSPSAEIVLATRSGNEAVFLNDLRNREDAALSLRVSLENKHIPIVAAISGQTGKFRGVDYRNVEVLADLRAIPNSPWFLVTKVDMEEVWAKSRGHARNDLYFASFAIALSGVGIGFVYRQRQARLYRQAYRAEKELREAHEEFRMTLYSIGDGVIATDAEGRVTRLNPVAEALTGWAEAEARGREVSEVFNIINEETRDSVENPVYRVLREGTIVGLANHTLLIAKDGVERPIADSGSPIRDEQDEMNGVVLVFRDQSVERAAQQGLQASEERLRLALKAAGQGLYDLNVQTGEATVSPEYAMMLGYDPEDFVETNARWRERLHPDDWAPISHAFEDYISGSIPEYRIEFRQRTRDGAWKWILSLGEIVEHDAQGNPLRMLGTHTDITALKQAEEALRASETRFRTLVENAPDGILMQTAGCFVYANKAALALFGAETEEQLLGRPVLDCIGPAYRENVRQRLAQLNEARRNVPPVEQTILTIAGVETYVEVSAAPIEVDGHRGALAFVRDIRQRKQAEASIRLRDAALNAAANAVLITDRTGAIEWANPAFLSITGYEMQEVLGRNPRELVNSGRHEPEFFQHLWTQILSGGTWEGEVLNRRKDGSLYTEAMTITPLRDEKGEISHFIAIKRDISEQKLMESQLRQEQKMGAVGRLAGGVAHDFNNMLSVILGNAEVLLEEIDASRDEHVPLIEIQKAAKRSAALTRQLLAFARKQTIVPVVMDLNETIEDMLKMLRRLIGEDITLKWNPGRGLWPVKMDPAQIDQILANLAVNARDAITGVGTLSIATANVSLDEAYCEHHEGFTPGEYIHLTVSDTGHGMDGETLEKAFEPFFTTKAVGEGTGLGLSTVYGIVKQNDGFVNVYSEPGHGTTFSVYLPRCVDVEAPVNLDAPPDPPARGCGEVVLLVEDESELLRLCQRMLGSLGYEVLAAESAAEALRVAAEREGAIDLLVTDVIMPEMSGRELWESLKQSRPGLPCLYTSGYTADIISHHGVLEPGMHFLQKPFNRSDLARKMRQALGRS